MSLRRDKHALKHLHLTGVSAPGASDHRRSGGEC
jgi:hypothetical protein